MNDAKSYSPPVQINETMEGECIAEIIESNHPDFSVGDIVVDRLGWASHGISNGANAKKIDKKLAHISTGLGVLGMPGLTAWVGLNDILNAKKGETLVVSAATGAVGSLVGQLAKLKGLRVIGIAGGLEKNNYAIEELGYDTCIDHKVHDKDELREKISAAAPNGIDCYFENVGGEVTRAIAPLLNKGSRVPVCGFISQYNEEDMLNAETPFHVLGKLKPKPKHRFFVVHEWVDEFEAATELLSGYVSKGSIRYRETITKGFENAPQALRDVLSGKNFGKQIIEI